MLVKSRDGKVIAGKEKTFTVKLYEVCGIRHINKLYKPISRSFREWESFRSPRMGVSTEEHIHRENEKYLCVLGRAMQIH